MIKKGEKAFALPPTMLSKQSGHFGNPGVTGTGVDIGFVEPAGSDFGAQTDKGKLIGPPFQAVFIQIDHSRVTVGKEHVVPHIGGGVVGTEIQSAAALGTMF